MGAMRAAIPWTLGEAPVNDRTHDLAALPPMLRKALEDQRSIDASVRAFERAVWGARAAAVPRTVPDGPPGARTVTPFRPRPAAPEPSPRPPLTAIQPVADPAPATEPTEPTSSGPEPSAADLAIAAGADAGGEVSEEPDTRSTPAVAVDSGSLGGTESIAAEAAIRDRLQPHWRDAHDRVGKARHDLEMAERALEQSPFLTRLSRKRQRRLEEAKRVLNEAEAVRTAVDTLWAAESMRRQYALLQGLAEQDRQGHASSAAPTG